MKNCAIYAGSFDPFTNGHMDIVARALKIFKKVVIVIAKSPTKKSFLTYEARQLALEEIYKNDPNVQIDIWSGLLVDYAKKNNIKSIVRGLRPTGDFEIEFQMASMNRKLNSDCDTVFLPTGEKYYYISSSLVKEVFSHGGDVEEFVPAVIMKELKKLKE